MKKARGCGMRSAVGFLSRRAIGGQPRLKEDFQRRRLAGCSSLYKKDMLGHFGCVNAIEFSNNGGQWLVSGGDDRRVLLWHMEKAIHSRAKPIKLKGEHLSNIFCLAFDSTNKRVFSGGNDEQVILHDVERGETLNVFLHDDAVYGLSVSPVNDNVFASSSDDGRVLIWDTREPPHGEPFCLANYPSAFHSVMFNPVEPRLLATANSKEGVGLWDIRKPRSSLLRYGGSLSLQSAMSVRFNSMGTQLLALRRRLPPVLYELHSRLPSFQFDNQGYFNSCTMKSCCFAGDHDQYILSGSDDFNLYMWRIPNDPEAGGPGQVVNRAFMVLKGHRSIVNQVRFNPHTYMICSSGVEKVIKVWSPYQQPYSVGDLEGLVEDKSRSLYTHEEYISLVLNSGSGLSHDYVSQSVQEDPRMMAFFDSLVRREIEGWSSDSDSDLSEGAILQLQARARRSTHATRSMPRSSANVSAAHHSDSEHSSSSSLAGQDASGSERNDQDRTESQRSRTRPRASAFLLDLVNEDSDSSGFWLDPMPRPRSPSPHENSSLSSHASSAGLASSSSSSPSSSSSSSSSTDGVDEDLRRSRMRQRNAARWRRNMGLSGRDSAHNLHGATDASNYPSISIPDQSSPSSSSGDEGRPFRNRGKEKPSGHGSSPTHLTDRQMQSRCRSRFTSSFSGGDTLVERAKSRVGFLADSGEEPERGRTSGEELSALEEINMTVSSRSTAAGVNGHPHVDENHADSIHPECSGTQKELNKNSGDSRTQGEHSGREISSVSGKRTCSDSGDEEDSPSEKRAKTH
ncbi:DDB1- and CUL4-associated factor 5-like [Carassius gibelio]|uniref:DDB1- and CUL4-associated factor 5-like n=1 Tax=Carassius gibelio TaxID=101364 RepID=UPI002277D0CE|nr:DDB1- and CUL4-associated factor 5-like [Carassius gibelio]